MKQMCFVIVFSDVVPCLRVLLQNLCFETGENFKRLEMSLSRPHEKLAMYSVKAQLEYSTGFLCCQGISVWVFFLCKHGPTYKLKNAFNYVLFKVIGIPVLVLFSIFCEHAHKFYLWKGGDHWACLWGQKKPNGLPHSQVASGRRFF